MPDEPSRSLIEVLASPDVALIAGAHDALSSRLVERAGFDAVWSSSYGVSLSAHCIADADLVTMTECVEATRRMAQTVRIPVLADCNAGFGDAINVMRAVREMEAAGAAGICIEDNPFPKRCSLYGGWARRLLPQEEMAGKVRAARASRRRADFVVVARIESLIAGESVDAALARADAYADAGADALLVHGRQFGPLASFTERWRGESPLIAVPTLYPHVPVAQLASAGFRAVIFPNQAVRAAVRAMCDALAEMRTSGRCGAVEDAIASLAEIEELVDLPELRAAESRYSAARQAPG